LTAAQGLDDPLPCYSYEQLREACVGFSEGARLGSGGFGTVYRGTINHTPVAVKVLKQEGRQGEREFLAEVEVLSKICHPNIVMLLGCCREQQQQCVVYEHMENGSLQDRLDMSSGTPPLPWAVRLRIAVDMTRALCFLHGHPSQQIIHHDLKPSNVLLDDRFLAKLGDVGLARIRPPASSAREQGEGSSEMEDTELVGTWAYMDPEYQETGHYSAATDVYALGVSLMQLLTALPANGLPLVVSKAIETQRLSALMDISDPRAGQWPLALLRQLYTLAIRCTAERSGRMGLEQVMQELLEMSPRPLDSAS
jgi:serine/threonine protein kinase